MAIVAGDIVRVDSYYNLNDLQTNQNVTYYLAGAGVSDTDVNVANAIESAQEGAYNNLNTVLDADIEPGGANFSKYDPVTQLWEQFATRIYTDPDGSAAGNTMPNINAGVIRFFTDGFGQQGRKYLSGFTSTQAANNEWVGTGVTALTNFAAAWNNAVAVAGGNMLPGWWSTKDSTHRAYNTTFAVNAVCGHQTRRKAGRGSV